MRDVFWSSESWEGVRLRDGDSVGFVVVGGVIAVTTICTDVEVPLCFGRPGDYKNIR